MPEKYMYVLYDGRACGDQDTDAASMFCAGIKDIAEAVEMAPSYGQCALYRYTETAPFEHGHEKWIGDFDESGKPLFDVSES
jgi:hypothetical protein